MVRLNANEKGNKPTIEKDKVKPAAKKAQLKKEKLILDELKPHTTREELPRDHTQDKYGKTISSGTPRGFLRRSLTGKVKIIIIRSTARGVTTKCGKVLIPLKKNARGLHDKTLLEGLEQKGYRYF